MFKHTLYVRSQLKLKKYIFYFDIIFADDTHNVELTESSISRAYTLYLVIFGIS